MTVVRDRGVDPGDELQVFELPARLRGACPHTVDGELQLVLRHVRRDQRSVRELTRELEVHRASRREIDGDIPPGLELELRVRELEQLPIEVHDVAGQQRLDHHDRFADRLIDVLPLQMELRETRTSRAQTQHRPPAGQLVEAGGRHDLLEGLHRRHADAEPDHQAAFPRAKRTLPGRFPVCSLRSRTITPFTKTYSIPAGYSRGRSKVARSATFFGSKTTMSARQPTRRTPRSASPKRAACIEVIFFTACSKVTSFLV